MTLCVSFQELSRWTWSQLDRSFRLNAPFNEETITETILLELKDRHPNDISVVSFSKFQEKQLGADWEFWFIDKYGNFGVGWRVQAKRLYRPSEQYRALKPSETLPSSQIQTLITQAQNQGLVPVYCFYNSVSDPKDVYRAWTCGSYSKEKELFGCSFAHAVNVRNLGKKDFKSISQISIPWHCAVCCKAFAGTGDNLPNRISGMSNDHPRFGYSLAGQIELVKVLPRYIKLLADQISFREETVSPERDIEEILYKLSEAETKKLRGITVFKDTGIND